MVDFQRLMRSFAALLFGVVFGGWMSYASAAEPFPASPSSVTPASITASYWKNSCTGGTTYNTADLAASMAGAQAYADVAPYTDPWWGAWQGSYMYRYAKYNGSTVCRALVSMQWTCPAGSTKATTTGEVTAGTYCLGPLVCPEGSTGPDGQGMCTPLPEPCSQDSGKYWNGGTGHWGGKPWEGSMYSGTGSTPDTGCVSGCQVTFEFDTAFGFAGGWSGFGYAKNSGAACVSQPDGSTQPPTTEAKPKTTPEYDCAASGQTWGTVNGTVVCTGEMENKTTESTKTTTKTNADNSTETTTETTECQGETCTTTTETTTCDAQQNCNTATSTETTTPSDGPGGNGTGDKPESKWGGQCEQGFACSGDAIQCAISLEIHKQGCALAVADEHKTRGQGYLAGTLEADDPRSPGNKTTTAMGSWSEEGGMAGSCPADWSTSLMGQQIVVPWSGLCPHFEAMGYAMLAIAWVIAASILRGVL